MRRAEGNYPTTPHQARRFWLLQHGKLSPDPPSAPEPIDWRSFDAKLCEVYHWTPQQIDDMTLPEIYAALSPPQEPPLNQIVEQAQAYKLLTPEEKLDMAMFLQDTV